MAIIRFKKQSFTDCEVIEGLQKRSRQMENWFYNAARRYYYDHYNEVFFDLCRKQEIFQTAFLKLWTEIYNGKIKVNNDTIYRQQVNGEYKPMTCSLTTFLMAFAKNENREIMRNAKDVYVELLFDSHQDYDTTVSYDTEEDELAQKERIIDSCLLDMSPHCVEILTLFYYQQKSLDEILAIRKDKSSTKDGLKSAKTKCMATLRKKVTEQMGRMIIYE